MFLIKLKTLLANIVSDHLTLTLLLSGEKITEHLCLLQAADINIFFFIYPHFKNKSFNVDNSNNTQTNIKIKYGFLEIYRYEMT